MRDWSLSLTYGLFNSKFKPIGQLVSVQQYLFLVSLLKFLFDFLRQYLHKLIFPFEIMSYTTAGYLNQKLPLFSGNNYLRTFAEFQEEFSLCYHPTWSLTDLMILNQWYIHLLLVFKFHLFLLNSDRQPFQFLINGRCRLTQVFGFVKGKNILKAGGFEMVTQELDFEPQVIKVLLVSKTHFNFLKPGTISKNYFPDLLYLLINSLSKWVSLFGYNTQLNYFNQTVPASY